MATLCAIAATAGAISCGKTRTSGDGFDETNDGAGGVSVAAGGGTLGSGGAAPPEEAPVDNACVNGCFAEDGCVEEASGVACACATSTPQPCDQPFRTLGTLDGEDVCGAQVISNDGSTIAGVCTRSVPNPKPGTDTTIESLSVWRLGEGPPSLTEIGLRILPSGLSADGTTVVGSWAGDAFRWNAGKLEILDDVSVANAVTASSSQ